ncbi:hypothetical protein LPMP_231720 [Leishmania panamensis]|uniref:Uncharacterized protein n=1 Tax=Leishmania panamensis TaxID=5679 RepID=A0A088RRU6_LEIPA|nr:hypothetical protein LPMP_231720 [Leishmania panamensis]AIN98620.1 hypothetical protein LPMP_231720 [Leishmania panamensis]
MECAPATLLKRTEDDAHKRRHLVARYGDDGAKGFLRAEAYADHVRQERHSGSGQRHEEVSVMLTPVPQRCTCVVHVFAWILILLSILLVILCAIIAVSAWITLGVQKGLRHPSSCCRRLGDFTLCSGGLLAADAGCGSACVVLAVLRVRRVSRDALVMLPCRFVRPAVSALLCTVMPFPSLRRRLVVGHGQRSHDVGVRLDGLLHTILHRTFHAVCAVRGVPSM